MFGASIEGNYATAGCAMETESRNGRDGALRRPVTCGDTRARRTPQRGVPTIRLVPRSQVALGNGGCLGSCTSSGANALPVSGRAKQSFEDQCVPKCNLGTRDAWE